MPSISRQILSSPTPILSKSVKKTKLPFTVMKNGFQAWTTICSLSDCSWLYCLSFLDNSLTVGRRTCLSHVDLRNLLSRLLPILSQLQWLLLQLLPKLLQPEQSSYGRSKLPCRTQCTAFVSSGQIWRQQPLENCLWWDYHHVVHIVMFIWLIEWITVHITERCCWHEEVLRARSHYLIERHTPLLFCSLFHKLLRCLKHSKYRRGEYKPGWGLLQGNWIDLKWRHLSSERGRL